MYNNGALFNSFAMLYLLESHVSFVIFHYIALLNIHFFLIVTNLSRTQILPFALSSGKGENYCLVKQATKYLVEL